MKLMKGLILQARLLLKLRIKMNKLIVKCRVQMKREIKSLFKEKKHHPKTISNSKPFSHNHNKKFKKTYLKMKRLN